MIDQLVCLKVRNSRCLVSTTGKKPLTQKSSAQFIIRIFNGTNFLGIGLLWLLFGYRLCQIIRPHLTLAHHSLYGILYTCGRISMLFQKLYKQILLLRAENLFQELGIKQIKFRTNIRE